MSTWFWKLSLRKQGREVTLFAVTTEAMIESDLDGGPDTSLIFLTRQHHRQPPSVEQDHRDLAIGAISAYAVAPPYDRTACHIEHVDHIPGEEPSQFTGRRGLVPIWETTDAHRQHR